jgi:AraC-like DNA-binding protein
MGMEAVYNKEKKRFDLVGDYFMRATTSENPCSAHTHDYIELVYHFSGTAVHSVDGVQYTVRRGDMLIIDRGCEHSFCPKPRVRYCDIMLRPEFFDKSLSNGESIVSFLTLSEFREFATEIRGGRRLIHFSHEDGRSVEALIRLTIDEQRVELGASEGMRRSALNMLLTLIFRNMRSHSRLEMNSELLGYVRENCAEKISATLIADRCGYTAEHFSRKFRTIAKMTFIEYLSECRLLRARDLLLNTHKTLDVIIEESGFSSRGEFFRKFREKFGETPLKFKKSQKSVL